MTPTEFATVIAELSITMKVPFVKGDPSTEDYKREHKASMNAYYRLLGDLDWQVFRNAADRVCLAHNARAWSTFPSVGELREAAARTIGGETSGLTGIEAFGKANLAVIKIDPSIVGAYYRNGVLYDSQAQAMTANLPPMVLEAIKRFGGWRALLDADPNFARREFAAIYDELAVREKLNRLLPASVREAIAAIGEREQPKAIPHAAAQSLAASFGKVDA